jgi:hypothetical protein
MEAGAHNADTGNIASEGKAVVSRQASGGPRGFEQLEQFPLCVPKKILVDTVSSTKKPYGYMV